MKAIDQKYLLNEDNDLFVKKHDIVIQTCGIKKSVHFIYTLLTLRQSESARNLNVDACWRNTIKKTSMKLENINSKTKTPIASNSFIRYRLTTRVRADLYSTIDYTSIYRKFKNWTPLQYNISLSNSIAMSYLSIGADRAIEDKPIKNDQTESELYDTKSNFLNATISQYFISND